MAKTVQSRKAKGRNLQKWVRDKIIEILDISPEDVVSTSMGASGTDVKLSKAAKDNFGSYAIECKNVEKLNVWAAWNQAKANTKPTEIPLLFIKRNREVPLVLMDAELFIKLHKKKA